VVLPAPLHLHCLALSFAHQFNTGADFATHPLNRVIWGAMYGVVAALLIAYRGGRPLAACGVTVRGRRHDERRAGTYVGLCLRPAATELDAEAGQFFMWRFLTREGWWQAHPFSLSAAPNGRWLRLTVKALGDHSAKVARLRPGTKVLVEGPYGAFTDRRRRQGKVLFIAAGVGVTPLRALFESIVTGPGGSVFIYRAGAPGNLALRAELDDIAAHRQAPVHYLVGSRRDHPSTWGRTTSRAGARRRRKGRVPVRPCGVLRDGLIFVAGARRPPAPDPHRIVRVLGGQARICVAPLLPLPGPWWAWSRCSVTSPRARSMSSG